MRPPCRRAGPRPPNGWSSNRFTGLAIEGFDPVAYFTDARAAAGRGRNSRPRRPARSGVSATRATAPPSSPIPKSTAPNSAATIRSIWRAGVTFAGNPRFWLVADERLYLFGREQSRDAFAADPARFLQERDALAGAGADAGAVEGRLRRLRRNQRRRRRIAPGNEFRHDEILAPGAEMQAAAVASVILPPAAVTTAWPAATSHSQVGESRG